MQIHIQKDMTISQFQDQFHALFPYLKIEFYHLKHSEIEGSSKKDQVHHASTFAGILPDFKEGDLMVDGSMQVAALEKQFADQFGLSAQVFRKSGNVWLQTVRTDNWSLDQQNKEAEAILNSNTTQEPGDYHEQE